MVFYDALLQGIFLRLADGIVFVRNFVTDEWVTTAPTKPRGLPPPQALPDVKHEFLLCATKVLHSPSTLVKHFRGNWEMTQAKIFQRIGRQNISAVRETPDLPRPLRGRVLLKHRLLKEPNFFMQGVLIYIHVGLQTVLQRLSTTVEGLASRMVQHLFPSNKRLYSRTNNSHRIRDSHISWQLQFYRDDHEVD